MEYMVTDVNKYPRITHKQSGAFVVLEPTRNGWSLAKGMTPVEHRGKGIGSDLRALATLFSHSTKKKITHHGININKPYSNNVSPSTRIVRKLGWRSTGNYNSEFDPALNDISKAMKQLGLARQPLRALPGNQQRPGRPSRM